MNGYTSADAYADFIGEANVILVRNQEELDAFCDFLGEYNPRLLEEDFLRGKKEDNWDYWTHLAEINGHNSEFIMFEAQNAGDYGYSITFWGAEQYDEAIDWYGQEPIEMANLM